MCHPDCGPITDEIDDLHAHENKDGRCWHENDDMDGWTEPCTYCGAAINEPCAPDCIGYPVYLRAPE